MEGTGVGLAGAGGTALLTVGAWLGAMLMGGLMTAHFRVSGLYRNGLLENGTLGPILRDYLEIRPAFPGDHWNPVPGPDLGGRLCLGPSAGPPVDRSAGRALPSAVLS